MRGHTESYLGLLRTGEGGKGTAFALNATGNGTLSPSPSPSSSLSPAYSSDDLYNYGASSVSILLAMILIFLIVTRATESAQKVVKKLSDKMQSAYGVDQAEAEKHREELQSLAAFSSASWSYINVVVGFGALSSSLLFSPLLFSPPLSSSFLSSPLLSSSLYSSPLLCFTALLHTPSQNAYLRLTRTCFVRDCRCAAVAPLHRARFSSCPFLRTL